MRFAKQRDRNEASIVAVLTAAGARVQRLNEAGVPDLMVKYAGKLWLLEVKRERGKRGGQHHHGHLGDVGELTAAQVRWWAAWDESPVIVRTPDEALAAIGAR